ncbi:unnamed protein product [Rhizophagus irregularis]|uniref:Uncharacterized protein n=1 Tax=Rhizophagus irregularis TaxID=588596 RepID=A0A2I1GBQ2_9GLOM|nr:hypothetical protein RhiirA4_399457 [Rhizophagus irregularis]CAB4439398.1 unnamed protein product [Rhizophagus irregularis]
MKVTKLIILLLGLISINNVEPVPMKQSCFFTPCGDMTCSGPGFFGCAINLCVILPDFMHRTNAICCNDVEECKKIRHPSKKVNGVNEGPVSNDFQIPIDTSDTVAMLDRLSYYASDCF